MIVVRLRGGLGNQLFQYAAGFSLAKHVGVPLKLDLYTYTKHKYRKYELHHFNIEEQLATRAEVHRFTGPNFLVRFLNKRENYLRCPGVFAQPHYHFYEDFLNLPAPLYLSGYWQSEKYFLPIASDIRKMYMLKQPLDARNAALADEMAGTESVAVHVRLGDYVSNVQYQSFFGTLDTAYYRSAIAYLMQQRDNLRFFVFSDSVAKAKSIFADLPKATFVDHNQRGEAHKDLFLMSQCRHNIIANSTFSWWGAWLNANPHKVVVAPQRWFARAFNTQTLPVYPVRLYNTKDLIPTSWIRL
jgi:hypothetical protein